MSTESVNGLIRDFNEKAGGENEDMELGVLDPVSSTMSTPLTSNRKEKSASLVSKTIASGINFWRVIKWIGALAVAICILVLLIEYNQEKSKADNSFGKIASIQREDEALDRLINDMNSTFLNQTSDMNKSVKKLFQRVNELERKSAKQNNDMDDLKLNISKTRDAARDMNETIIDMKQRTNTLADAINDLISSDVEITTLLEDLNITVQDMNAVIDRLNVAWCESHDGIEYNGTCIWEEDEPEEMTLINAYRKCNSIAPSVLPDIISEEQYRMVMSYLRRKIPLGETYVNAWTGMTREYWSETAMLSNGNLAPFTKTQTSPEQWDEAERKRTNIYLHVQRDLGDDDQGMGAVWPSTTETGTKTLLCQRLPIRAKAAMADEAEVWCISQNGIKYNGTCLWAEIAPSIMNTSDALAKCKEVAPSKLPDIYGGQEYIEITEYLRSKIPYGDTYARAWTGLTGNSLTKRAILSSGEPAPYTKSRTLMHSIAYARNGYQVYIIVKKDTTLPDQGMGFVLPGYKFYGSSIILCQRFQ